MATTIDDVNVRIVVQGAKEGSRELESFNESVKGVATGIKNTGKFFDGFSANFLKVAGVVGAASFALKGAVSAVENLVAPYLEAEDAVTRLNLALKLSGSQNISSLTEEYIRLGDSLEALGIASTEQILALAKIGTAAGQTAKQTQELIKVAADLSVAREIPLETAFKSLSATLKGSAGALSIFMPELQDFTKEQLKAGDAVKYISMQLGGFAQANLETYSGQLTVLKSRLGDVTEELGKVVVEGGNAASSISTATLTLQAITDVLKTNSGFFQDIISGILKVAEVLTSVLGATFIGVFASISKVVGSFVISIGYLQKAFSMLIPGVTNLGDSIVQMGVDISRTSNELFAFTADIVKNGTMFPEVAKGNASALDEMTKKTQEAQEAFKNLTETMLNDEQRQALETLKNKIIDLGKSQAEAGKTGIDLINAQADASKIEIDIIAKKIAGTGALREEYKKLVAQAKQYVELQRQAKIQQINDEFITKVTDQYKTLGDEIAKQNMTQREFIDYQLKKELELLDIKRKSAAFASGEAQDLLDATEARLKAKAEKEKKEAPNIGPTFKAFTEAGKTVASGIADVFTSGALEFVGAAASAVGAIVTAANAALDLIPNMINSIADLFNKITDFPNILLGAFSNLFGSVTRLVTDFIPSLVKFIPELLKNFDQFVVGLISAFTELFKSLPQIIFDALKDLPSLVENIVSGMVSAVPEIMISAIQYLIEYGPQIALKIFKAVSVDIPIAIVKGILKGTVKIATAIKNALTGKNIKLPKLTVDPKSIQSAASKFAGSTSKMFKVGDLLDAAKDPLEKITTGIEEAFSKGKNWIMEAWLWVRDNILMPIWDFIIKPFVWVYDHVIKPIWDIVVGAWGWVNTNIIKPIWNIIVGAWNWVNEQILQPIWNIITGAWNWVIEKVINPLSELGQKIAQPLIDAFNGLQGFFKAIGDVFASLFKLDFDGMKTAIKDAFAAGGEILANAFKGLINPMVDIFNGLIDLLNRMVIPGVGWSISAGKLGSWSGSLFDEIDLIPGEIGRLQKLASGGLVENLPNLSGFGTDTVGAALTPGEFVVNRRGVEAAGLGLLNNINRGQSPSSGNTVVNIEVNIDAKMAMDEGYIRGKLIPQMTEELRRASLDGKFVISQRGIR